MPGPVWTPVGPRVRVEPVSSTGGTMATESKYITRMREQYRKWNDSKAGCVQDWLDMLDDDIQWRSLPATSEGPGLEFASECHSKAEVVRYFERLGRDWEMVSYEPHDFLSQGTKVVMLGRCSWRNRRTGRVVSTPKADYIRFKGDRIVEFAEYFDTAQVLAAAQPG